MSGLSGISRLVALVTYSSVAMSCPFDPKDPLLQMRDWADTAIVRIDTVGTAECTGAGTGFSINAAGNILTAGHVVPATCAAESTSITVRWSTTPGSPTLSAPVSAHVLRRSSLDVALLELDNVPNGPRQYLRLPPQPIQEATYKNRCVILASHYYEQTDAYTTFAEIASIALEGNIQWALSGEGFNSSRSGSPLISSDGRVVAIFVARPEAPDDRDKVIQSRAYVLPLHKLPSAEINLASVQTLPGHLPPFLTKDDSSAAPLLLPRVRTAFGISITEQGFQTGPDLPTFVLGIDGTLSEVGSLQEGLLQALVTGKSLVRQTNARRHFTADPGFAFDPKSLTFKVASVNPQRTPLPSRLCEGAADRSCHFFSEMNRVLELRFTLYPGFDGRRAWIDAEAHLDQMRQ